MTQHRPMGEWKVAPVTHRALWDDVQAERFNLPSEHVQYLRRLLARADAGLQRLAQIHPAAAAAIELVREDIIEVPR